MAKNPLPILTDVDGVLADFLKAFMAEANRITGQNCFREDLHQWDILTLYPAEIHDQILASIGPGFCRNLEVTPGAKEAFQELSQLAPVYAVTAPWTNPTWVWERNEWLQEKFQIHRNQVIHTDAKHLVTGCCLIDDKPSNLEAWVEANYQGIGILWSAPYNQSYQCSGRIWRANTWQDVIRYAASAVVRAALMPQGPLVETPP